MRVYTIKDIKTFERDEYGRLICPTGDYSQIKSFAECCRFAERCNFGAMSSFGERCSFGAMSSFGEGCSFGERCNFAEWCNFGEWCSFAEGCNLENNLKFENIEEQIDRVLKIDRIGSRRGCSYFFKTPSEIYVRCGCFFGTIAEFENKVNETHKDNEQYRKEYIEAIKYAKVVM